MTIIIYYDNNYLLIMTMITYTFIMTMEFRLTMTMTMNNLYFIFKQYLKIPRFKIFFKLKFPNMPYKLNQIKEKKNKRFINLQI